MLTIGSVCVQVKQTNCPLVGLMKSSEPDTKLNNTAIMINSPVLFVHVVNTDKCTILQFFAQFLARD